PGVASGGARRALVVGINAYTEKPLSGCVADARLWEATLQGLGFTTTRLLDGEATYERLRTELRYLVTSSRPGDVVVFQYAGHGTQVPDVDGDEDSGPDEALCPVDLHTGALFIDDDISDILAELPAGVSFTFFLDSCHSGGSTRFGFGPAPRATGPGAQSRFLPMTPELVQAHLEFRKSRGRARVALARGALRPLRGVLFAACQDNELAWEINGQGAFTLRATGILRDGLSGLTNAAFQDRVLGAFGAVRQQTPVLRAADELLDRPLLAPLDGATAGRGLAGAAPAALADELQRFAERLKGLHG
ncbi:MAG TPA: caspase family protein, partial [Thermoanaerobaculia bacterium]|nr:caspase family protein [Thermoanaerobaculia bacterium]